MTQSSFEQIVLSLGRETFVRHSLWLNYPERPALMGVQFVNSARLRSGVRPTKRKCNCGRCDLCQKREVTLAYRPMRVLIDKLSGYGLEYDEKLNFWTVARTEELRAMA